MAVKRFFGLPGCGKTTTFTWLAYKGLTSGKYDNVYGNVHLSLPGYTYVPFDVLGKYQLENCLVLIDEAMVECGDRDYKGFGKEKIEFFVMHRHYSTDVYLFSQEADGVDKKVRSVSADMYYVRKGLFLGSWVSNIYKIPYGIVWPSENSNGENLGKIVMGYMKPSFLSKMFAKRLWRPKYYKWFDSWEARQLPPLPRRVEIAKNVWVDIVTNPGRIEPKHWILRYLRKTAILLRWERRYKKTQKRLARKEKRQLRFSDRRAQDAGALHRLDQIGVYDLPQGVKIT